MFQFVRDIIMTVYENFINVCLLSFLFMYFYMSIKENGLKGTVIKWINEAKSNSSFRRMFLLIFYVFLVLTKTILTRTVWYDPYGKIFTGWTFISKAGHVSLEAVENIVLFIPVTFLLMWNMDAVDIQKITIKKITMNMTILSIIIGFIFSFGIEFIQLITRLGTFQFSDIFYNTVGGIIGVGLYVFILFLIRFMRRTTK